ncbi:uncharacterized protein LOC122512150 [Leptopilina heterotoma]|uniref:uncharacterized protein LOC122512150 n=1 Tax=Leptopilina heterotoma TaxID=63436 RepID=UPI001CA9DB08|nr:uncharacterized protein LOC122512150 [Leptopilina heterotoma]
MKVCIYCNSKNDGDITFHKIPSDKERRQKWLNAIKLPEERIDKKSYLCSKHFEDDTFCCQIVNKMVHRFLHIDAVPSIFTENHSGTVKNESDSPLFSMTMSNEKEDEKEEDYYFYKIENGIIKRYLQNNLKPPDFVSTSQENIYESTEKTLNKNINTESAESKTKLFIKDTQYVPSINESNYQAPLQVQVSPNRIRNEQVYPKNVICDLKFNEFNNHVDSNITIDAEDIPFDQIEFSNVNRMNEVEFTDCESESLKITNQETTSDIENLEIKMKEDKVDELCNGNFVNSSIEEINKENDNIATIDHIDRKNSEMQDNYVKNLLHDYLKKNKNCEMNIVALKNTELTLTELFKRILNHVELLERKLEDSTERNKQYEKQIEELKNLLK